MRNRAKISGPLLDRIDIQVEVPSLPQDELTRQGQGEASEAIQVRVEAAHQRQLQRQGKPNALLGTKDIDTYCETSEESMDLLKRAIAKLNLSARAYHRILKVARTIADLEGSEVIATNHVAEAVQYRRLDRSI